MIKRAWAVAAAAVLALSCAGCAPAAAPAPQPFRVVILGDSLSVDPPHDCSGCVSWVAQYESALESSVGRPVMLTNDAVPDSGIDQLDRSLSGIVAADLAAADLVIVWIGTNDTLPWPDDSPCGPAVAGDGIEPQFITVENYSSDCIDATLDQYADSYATLFADVAAASPKAQRLALETYDNWRGNPNFAGTSFSAARMEAVFAKVAPIYAQWNVAQCEAAVAAGFECEDTYHLIDGADGTRAGGDLFSADGTHLSQAGHDAVAGLLAGLALKERR